MFAAHGPTTFPAIRSTCSLELFRLAFAYRCAVLRPPQAIAEYVAQVATLAIHKNENAGPSQAFCPSERCEQGPFDDLPSFKQRCRSC